MTHVEYILTCSDHAKYIHEIFAIHGLNMYTLFKLKIISAREYASICSKFQSDIYQAIINGDNNDDL